MTTAGASGALPAAEALVVADLVTPTVHGIASRVLARGGGGTVTLFAFDEGEALSEHTAPFDALVFALEGTLALTIGGWDVNAHPGQVVRMPAGVPHSVEATTRARMLLVMLRQPPP